MKSEDLLTDMRELAFRDNINAADIYIAETLDIPILDVSVARRHDPRAFRDMAHETAMKRRKHETEPAAWTMDSFLWGFCVTLFTVIAVWTYYAHTPNSWVCMWSAGIAGFCVWPWIEAYRRGRDDG